MRPGILVLSTLLCLLLITASSCKKDKGNYMGSATVIGYDMALCACCGGLLIEIDGQASGQYMRVINAEEVGFRETDTYPVKIRLDWAEQGDYCGRKVIKITRLTRE